MKTIIAAFSSVILSAALAAGEPLYVVNTLGESLSKIDLTSGVVSNNILILGSDIGSSPNQIVLRDTIGYVVCSGTDEIHIVRFPSETSGGFIPTGFGSNPFWMTVYDSTTGFVTLLTENKLGIINMTSRAVTRKDSIGLSPAGMDIVNHMACIAISAFDFNTFSYGQGQLAVFDIRGDSVKGWVDVGTNPQYVLSWDNHAYVICTGDYFSTFGTIYIVDVAAMSVVDSILIGGSPGVGKSFGTPGGSDVAAIAAGGWASNGFIYSLDLASRAVIHGESNPILTGLGCSSVAWRRNGDLLSASFGPDHVSNMVSSTVYSVGDGPVDIDVRVLAGDINGDFAVNVVDVTALAQGLFVNNFTSLFPQWTADVNADGKINVVDITKLVQYLFQGGGRPKVGWTWHSYL